MKQLYPYFVCLLMTAPACLSRNLVADHNVLIEVSPDDWSIPQWLVDTAQENLGIYFGHKSHGRQIVEGLNAIQRISARYGVDISPFTDVLRSGVLSIRDGNTYVGDFFDGDTPANQVLSENDWINTCFFVWCAEFNYGAWPDVGVMWDSARVATEYLQRMEQLEQSFPAVQFIYCTGPAYHNAGAERSYNRFKLNNMIRRYCAENEKVLFDFADLDAWAYNQGSGEWERDTAVYEIDGEMVTVPHQHARYEYGPGTHATPESETVKAMAFWWLMTELASGELAVDQKKRNPETVVMLPHDGQNHPVWNLRGQSINCRNFAQTHLSCYPRTAPGTYIVVPPSGKPFSTQKMLLEGRGAACPQFQ